MKIAILGFDREGRASYEYFTGRGDAVMICDRDAGKIVPAGVKARLGDHYLDNLDEFDLLVRTPGLKPSLISDKNPTVGSKITSGTNEFLRVCPTNNIIGVTGTKGKGTTSTLIAEMLEELSDTSSASLFSSRSVHLGGNIGVPALSMLPAIQPDDWVVLELSSFQLMDVQASPQFAVCLMIAPEHQDWHGSLDEYYTAKEQLFARQTTGDVAIYYHDNALSKRIAGAGQGQKVPYYHVPGAEVTDNAIVVDSQLVCRTDELKLLGQHNWQNVCAAVTAVWHASRQPQAASDGVCPPGAPGQVAVIEAMRSVLVSFSGLEHRLEFVAEVNGTAYYDDSFGTTPETAIVAIQAFDQPKVVILGGSDKGASYRALAQTVKAGNVRIALLIGDQAAAVQAALDEVGFSGYQPGGETMAEIVATADSAALAGDVVLLSTACASFGMFEDYIDRGDQFKQAVVKLAAAATTA